MGTSSSKAILYQVKSSVISAAKGRMGSEIPAKVFFCVLWETFFFCCGCCCLLAVFVSSLIPDFIIVIIPIFSDLY
jgi:hypothetical protein